MIYLEYRQGKIFINIVLSSNPSVIVSKQLEIDDITTLKQDIEKYNKAEYWNNVEDIPLF